MQRQLKSLRRLAAPHQGTQSGATLVIGLILLLALTILGVSGMNTTTLEITMASNTQFHQDAFQAAEDGIDVPIAQRNFTTVAPVTVQEPDRFQSVTTFTATTPVPDIAFSMGTSSGSVQAYHFDVRSVGEGARNALSTHTQSFYVVGPGGP